MSRTDPVARAPARLVVFRPGALGDMVVAAPTLYGLKRVFPHTDIAYLSERHGDARTATSVEVAALMPCVSTAHLYSPNDSWLGRLRRMRRMLRPNGKDMLAYLCYQRRSALAVLRDLAFFWLVGFRRFTGARAALRDALHIRAAARGECESDRLFRLLAADGIAVPRQSAYALATDRAFGDRFWEEHCLEGTTVIAVCPYAKMQSKLWPLDCYAQALTRIAASRRIAFVFVGTRNDAAGLETIRARTTAHIVSALGCTLRQSAALLARSDLYLGNDTGPMHIAAVQGTPCVGIFSARDPTDRWRPFGERHCILRARVPCAGCMLATCYAEPAVCMAGISVDAVVDAVNLTLAESYQICLP